MFESGPAGAAADARTHKDWIQAETLLTLAELFRLTRKASYKAAFMRTLDWIGRWQVDWSHGSWYDTIDADLRPTGGKAGPWGGPYHTTRAVLGSLRLIDAITSGTGQAAAHRSERSSGRAARVHPGPMGRHALGQQIDEGPHLGRQLVAVRIDRVDRELHRAVGLEQRHQPLRRAGPRPRRSSGARNRPRPLRATRASLGTVADQIAGDAHGTTAPVGTGEPPLVAEWIKGVAQAIVLREVGRPVAAPVGFR